MTNHDISSILHEIAQYMYLEGENPFKIKAYDNASKIIYELKEDIEDYIVDKNLHAIKGVGKGISEVIYEFYITGEISIYKELKEKYPQTILSLFQVPNLGPKKIKTLYDELKISSLQELEYACNENRLVKLKGFGDKSQYRILKDVKLIKKNKGRYLIAISSILADEMLDFLHDCECIFTAVTTSAIRSREEIISHIDFLVVASDPSNILAHLENFPFQEDIIQDGNDFTIRNNFGPLIHLHIIDQIELFTRQFLSTGSETFINTITQYAKSLNIEITNEKLSKNSEIQTIKSENDIFEKLNLQFISPELRIDERSIESAKSNSLPDLIELSAIKGVFHNHTTWSDGSASIEEMALKAKEMGLEYIGISDHSKAAFYAGGLNEEQLLEQMAEIDKVNETIKGITILKGIEVDILKDGSLDLDDSVLSQCDFVIASAHSLLKLPYKEMTNRMIKALEHPLVTMIGHPTGRLILGRKGSDFDMELFFKTAKENNKILELNSNPHRLDLSAENLYRAKDYGIKISINPDAHRPEGLNDIRYGVDTARRAWLTEKDCINTLNLEDMMKVLKP